MRLIDADELYLGKFVEPRTEWHQGWNDALDAATTQAPAVDAVPVVHCKDCKWLWKENMLCIHPKHCDGMVAVCECDKDGFCSYGERKIKDVHKCP